MIKSPLFYIIVGRLCWDLCQRWVVELSRSSSDLKLPDLWSQSADNARLQQQQQLNNSYGQVSAYLIRAPPADIHNHTSSHAADDTQASDFKRCAKNNGSSSSAGGGVELLCKSGSNLSSAPLQEDGQKRKSLADRFQLDCYVRGSHVKWTF